MQAWEKSHSIQISDVLIYVLNIQMSTFDPFYSILIY